MKFRLQRLLIYRVMAKVWSEKPAMAFQILSMGFDSFLAMRLG
jgi:hypothetical protein